MTADTDTAAASVPTPGAAATVAFSKYTSFGNTFIIVDETRTPLGDDRERAAFARWALNPDFGLGGTDNVLYLRRPVDGEPEADWVFRIFEQDGSETLSCGNGLLSSAAVLHAAHGGTSFGVLTELPTGRPQRVRIGVAADRGRTWVNVGWPRPVPDELYVRRGPAPASGIDRVDGLEVPLPQDVSWTAGLPETVLLAGHLVFTGEPHLMLRQGDGLPDAVADKLFLAREAGGAGEIGLAPNASMKESNLLVDHLGRYVNDHCRDRFPQGIHLSFTRVLDPGRGLVETRTYERAIFCETLACGSGSVALAYMLQELGLVSGSTTQFWPHRCRWYAPDASLIVERTDDGWVLDGQPSLVCQGELPRLGPRTEDSA